MSTVITAAIDTTLDPVPVQPYAMQLQVLVPPEPDVVSPFSAFFDAALNMVNDANRMQTDAYQAQLDFATGRLDDILAVQMAMDRASNALSFTTQITNRIIESYREIMRMQL